ncbi:MAG: hypothetical protein IJW82_07980 [Clostridia bacterium]|nr:hypothetical protein [Clostridia bacterium]
METEITVRVLMDFEDIKQTLLNQGFKITSEYVLIDYYYSKYSISKLKKMSYKSLIKNSFLLRKVVKEKDKLQLCYKDKTIKNNCVIGETKIVSNIDDFENAIKIFKMANITNWCVSKNYSTVFRKGEYSFALQDVKDLGIFIEYEEDETMEGMTSTQKIDYMKQIVNNLGLKLGEDYSVKKPYLMLHKN